MKSYKKPVQKAIKALNATKNNSIYYQYVTDQ